MNGYLAQFISMLAFSLSNVLWRYPLRKLSPAAAILFRSFFSVGFFVIVLHLNNGFYFASGLLVLQTLLICLISFFGLYFFNIALTKDSTTATVIATTATFIFGHLTTIFLLKEKPTETAYLGMFIILAGIVLSDWHHIKKAKLSKAILFGGLASLFWGLTFPLLSEPSKSLGFMQTGFILEISVLVMAFLGFLFTKTKNSLVPKNVIQNLPILILLGCLAGTAVVFQTYTYTQIPVHIAGAISASTHLLSIFFAFLLFKEKAHINNYFGAGLATIGIYILIVLK